MTRFATASDLQAGQIHIWFANIDMPPSELRDFEALLSPREATRAQRFRFMRDRNRYVMRHGVLRILLGSYLEIEARRVEIQCDANGKPYLSVRQNGGGLQFSDSHSEIYAAFAFCRYTRIGVDIERIHQIPDMSEIVARHFTPLENSKFLACSEAVRVKLFYQFWTRKEALLKAQGEGLLRNLDCVDVATHGRGAGPWPVTIAGCHVGESFWVADLDGPAGFAAAVAVDGPVHSISVNYCRPGEY